MVEVVVAGGVNWDINLFVHNFPRPGEETSIFRISRGAGGKAGNVSVAAARLLGPHRVGIIAVLGHDEIAETQLRILQDEGVETSAIGRYANAESGQAYIVTDEAGENVIHTYFGANSMLSPELILNKVAQDMIRSAGITTIMDPPQNVIEAISRIASESGRPIAWDPGIRAEAGMKQLRNVLERVSYLFLNASEVEYMTGVSDPAEAAKRLREANPSLVSILKYGPEGCLMFGQQGMIRVPAIDLTEFHLRTVSTVGCGDAFLGAFSAAKALELSDKEALRWANWAGALKATKLETRGSPTRIELQRWMTQAGLEKSASPN